jgi:hypothetical protein
LTLSLPFLASSSTTTTITTIGGTNVGGFFLFFFYALLIFYFRYENHLDRDDSDVMTLHATLVAGFKMQAYPDYHQAHYHYPHPHLTQDASQNFSNGFSRGSSTSFAYPHQDYRYFVDCGELASRLCPTSLVDNNTLDAAGNPSSSNTFVIPEDILDPDQPILAPAPVYPQQPAMAVLLNPNAQLANQQHQIPQVSTIHTARPTVIRPYACTLCYKRQVLIFFSLCSS